MPHTPRPTDVPGAPHPPAEPSTPNAAAGAVDAAPAAQGVGGAQAAPARGWSAPLSLRIWLAVVLAVAVLTLLVGWVWRLAAEPPLRDVVVRDASGQVIGRGLLRGAPRPDSKAADPAGPPWPMHPMGPADAAHPRMGRRFEGADWADRPLHPAGPGGAGAPAAGEGGTLASPAEPEFDVRMHNGQMMRMHVQRAPASLWTRPPFGFAWMLIWVALAVALATYPIVRRLTRRLEALQAGVQRLGAGDLSARVDARGGDEVAYLAGRFNETAARIQALVGARDALLAAQRSLLANASHELRSPLARIRMGLELLGERPNAAVRDEIARNIGELDALVEEILLASRLDAQTADLGPIEPVDLLGLAAEECARVQAELDWIAPAPAQGWDVPGVAKLLRRALRNLLENARRHADGPVQLTLQARGAAIAISVCDRGPGVPEALCERIFEPFFRLPGASERAGGVGLGLALVRSIAQRHGGGVSCAPRAGGGACFTLVLPTQGPMRATSASTTAA